jgi:hypothetical protein
MSAPNGGKPDFRVIAPSVRLACRPVDWSKAPDADSWQPTPVYPGSVQSPCADCAEAIWIGPRQQEAVRAGLRAICFACGVAWAAQQKGVDVTSLGNPFIPGGGRAE